MEPLYKMDHLIAKELANGSRYVYERNTQLIILEKSDGSVVIGTLENQYENPFQEEKIKRLVEISLLGYNLPNIACSKDAVIDYNIYVNNFYDINENATETIKRIIKHCGNCDAKWDYLLDNTKILEHKDNNKIISLKSTINMDSSYIREGRYNARKYPFFNVTPSYHNEQVEIILSIIFEWFDVFGLKYYDYNDNNDSMYLSSFSNGYLLQDICGYFEDERFRDCRDTSIPKNYLVSQNLYEQALQENEYFDIYVKNLDEFLCKVVNDEIPDDEIAKQMLEISKYSIKYREITKDYYPFEKKLAKLYEKEPKN